MAVIHTPECATKPRSITAAEEAVCTNPSRPKDGPFWRSFPSRSPFGFATPCRLNAWDRINRKTVGTGPEGRWIAGWTRLPLGLVDLLVRRQWALMAFVDWSGRRAHAPEAKGIFVMENRFGGDAERTAVLEPPHPGRPQGRDPWRGSVDSGGGYREDTGEALA